VANPQEMIERIKENPQIAIGVGVGLVVLIVVAGVIMANMGGGGGKGEGPCAQKLDNKQMVLAQVKNPGRAIEIQALLARENIVVDRQETEGVGSVLSFREGATICNRDQALVSLVQSGLMDRNVGLEAFDQGDLTASREEKRIKLIRAQQGELARLIRKIKPVEDATVSLSIPEQSIFRKDQQPLSASVQVTIPSGSSLSRDKVRSIINLMVGSVQGLDAQHVALSDTNGNTYNSVLDTSAELDSKIEERDDYMRQKVSNQLDRLVGSGNYVVTVSTLLREAPQEVLTEKYDANDSAIHSRQRFSENLTANTGSSLSSGGPVSSAIPDELRNTMGDQNSSSNRGYKRMGEEVQYANTKEQILETNLPGMIEDISIAVTVDNTHYPKVMNQFGERVDMDTDDLKRLIARSASPKVVLDNVSIARVSMAQGLGGSGSGLVNTADEPALPEQNYWWLWAIGSIGVFMILIALMMYSGKNKNPELDEAKQRINRLQELANNQQQQLQTTQQQTQMLIENQQKQLETMTRAPQIQAPPPQQPVLDQSTVQSLKETLSDLKETIEEDELPLDELDTQIKTWIEST